MKINKFIIGWGVLLFMLCSNAAFATMKVTFSVGPVNNDQISYYWQGETSTADQVGGTPSNDFNAALGLGTPAKPEDSHPDNIYFFFSQQAHASLITSIRLWDVAAGTNGGHYTALKSYSNPYQSVPAYNFTNNYIYVYAAPVKAVITKYDEVATVTYSPSPGQDREVTFSSAQPDQGGYKTEIVQSEWDEDGNKTVVAGSSYTILGVQTGESHTVSVRHKNPWGTWSDWSDSVFYSAGGDGGPQPPFDLVLKHVSGSGINSFGMPFPGPWFIGANQITNAHELVVEINAAAGDNAVSSFGKWDETNQQVAGVMINYNGNVIDPTDVADLQNISLSRGLGYQIYVTKDVTVQIKNTQ